MNIDISMIALVGPIFFWLTAASSFFQSSTKPSFVKMMITLSSVIALLSGAAGATLVALNEQSVMETPLIGYAAYGLLFRLDPLSMIIYCMIGLLAFAIIRYSKTYLDGDSKHGSFLGRLAATIASVSLLVMAGNLETLVFAWILTSVSLHTLLLFYPERKGARVAAKKKFISARLGDLLLIGAAYLIYSQFQTTNLNEIFQKASAIATVSAELQAATILIAIAALLKSAQFPTHGWLVEVMETPTPVSALLHAGILNAGPFLVVRLSPLMDLGTVSPALLVVVGGFTALFSSVVLLTQPSVKVALGYSSVAHMGFMLLVCGLGVYSAAILHLVAHSFYKAHAFLSSGSVVETARAQKVKLPERTGSAIRIAVSFLMATGIYAAFAYMSGVEVFQNPALLAIGIILILGMSQIIAPATDAKAKWYSPIQGAGLAAVVAISFFTLETISHLLLAPVLPSESARTIMTLALASAVVVFFAMAIVIQIYGPTMQNSNFTRSVYVHLRNGLYANALIDRLIGSNKQTA